MTQESKASERGVPPGTAHVAILMCTYQGRRFLAQQLDSIAAQTHANWTLWVSDDGSSDGTLELLREYQRSWGESRLRVLHGPRAGFAANFMYLCRAADAAADGYAFADQDDVWESTKLQRALAWLTQHSASVPALYCARTHLIDQTGQPMGLSPFFARRPSFANALVENIAAGNTMLFNAAARAVVIGLDPGVPVALHDWWVYQVVSGCGGQVHFDPVPAVGYRQHTFNLVGGRAGGATPGEKLRRLLDSSWRDKVDVHQRALASVRQHLTPQHQRVLEQFGLSSESPRWWVRLLALRRSGVHRQKAMDQLGLWAATLLHRK